MEKPINESPDPTPEELASENPVLVELFRVNPNIRQYMSMYLSNQISWRECLEHSLIALTEQYTGALEMAKDAVNKLGEARGNLPQTTEMKLLVNESQKEELEIVLPGQETDTKLRLEIALGILGRIISPARIQAFLAGRANDFPPIQLSQGILQQISDLFRDNELERYITQTKICPGCGCSAWLIQGEKQICAVCDARRGKAEYRHRSDGVIEHAKKLVEFYEKYKGRVPKDLLALAQPPVE